MHEPTAEQLAEYLNMPGEKVRNALSVAPWSPSLDGSFNNDSDFGLLETISTDELSPDAALAAESFAHEINRLLSRLSPKERRVIELTYGMTGGLEMSPTAIGKEIGLSTETVRKIRNAALERLRHR
jgi:RNA polymerase sigma factor (sigma-70 family)